MFGYHDVSSDCDFDIWSPNPTAWGENAIENRAFSPFCKHMQECDDVVAAIVRGETSFTLDDDFNQSDLDYINHRLSNEYGIYANLTLE